MKKTKHTGLQAGIYRENTKKDEVFALSSSVLIFLALAAIFHTAANFSAILPLFGAGVLTCVVIALVRHFKKAKWLAPTLFIVALIAKSPPKNERKPVRCADGASGSSGS